MANPLFNQLSGNGNMNPLMQKIQQLKQQIGGDPTQYIQNMLNSGRITQEQYNQAVQQAQKLRSMLGN